MQPGLAPGAASSSPFDSGIAAQFNNGRNNAWSGGLSVQYSLPYLVAGEGRRAARRARQADPPGRVHLVLARLLAQPAGHHLDRRPRRHLPGGLGEVGIEATIPLDRAAGTNVGVVGLVHSFSATCSRTPSASRSSTERRRPAMRSIVTTLAVLGGVAASGPAFAHAFLERATLAVGSTVPVSPPEVAITFTEGVEPRFSSIAVQDAAGASVAAGEAHLAGGDTHLAVPLRPLAPRTYTVTWHATAVDTHRTQGSFRFTAQP